MKPHFYRIRDENNTSQPHPTMGGGIWATDGLLFTRVASGPAWVHFGNLNWWDEKLVELIPETAHNWLVENSRGGNIGVALPVDDIITILKKHVADASSGGGVGQIDYVKLADEIVDEEAKRLGGD